MNSKSLLGSLCILAIGIISLFVMMAIHTHPGQTISGLWSGAAMVSSISFPLIGMTILGVIESK